MSIIVRNSLYRNKVIDSLIFSHADNEFNYIFIDIDIKYILFLYNFYASLYNEVYKYFKIK